MGQLAGTREVIMDPAMSAVIISTPALLVCLIASTLVIRNPNRWRSTGLMVVSVMLMVFAGALLGWPTPTSFKLALGIILFMLFMATAAGASEREREEAKKTNAAYTRR